MKTSHSLSSFVKQIHKHHHLHGLKKCLALFFAKLSGVKNSQARLDSVKYYKTFNHNYVTKTEQYNQTGFISHFGPRQEPALVLHGNNPNSKLGGGFLYYKGSCVDYKKATGEKIVHKLLNVHDFVAAVKRDFGLDLHRTGNTGDKPLHLICCYAGGYNPDSLAGQMARELDRSVVCYDEGTPLITFPGLKRNMDEAAKVFNEEIFLDKLSGENNFLERKVLTPLSEIIHHPDNQPGKKRV